MRSTSTGGDIIVLCHIAVCRLLQQSHRCGGSTSTSTFHHIHTHPPSHTHTHHHTHTPSHNSCVHEIAIRISEGAAKGQRMQLLKVVKQQFSQWPFTPPLRASNGKEKTRECLR